MLQLQLKSLVPKLSKRTHFLCKLFLFCTAVHTGVLLILFLFLNNNTQTLRVCLTSHENVPIVCVPWIKTVKNVTQKVPVPIPKKNQKQKVIPKTSVKKKSEHPKKEPIKKVPEKKIVPMPKSNTKGTLLAKQTKKIEPKIEKKPSMVTSKKVEPEKKAPMPEKKREIKPNTQHIESIVVGRDDLIDIELIETIKNRMQQEWKRPMTMTAQATCQARIKLNKDGTREIILEQPSPALAVNMSIKNFLLSYDFPKQAYGKDIVITF